MMAKKYVNIYQYADFRKYLVDYQKARYSIDPAYSKNLICIKLGLPNTRSYFSNVLGGKKVTDTFIERFIKAFDMDKEESKYFKTLVHFNQASTDVDREILFDQLISLNKTPKKFINKNSYQYYSEWYHSAIRAVLDFKDFKNEFSEIGKLLQPEISPKKVEDSIKLLSKLKLIKKNEKGFFKPTEKSITTGPYIKDELIKQYQLNQFELGKRALLSRTGKTKNMSTMTISLSEKSIKKIESKIQKFKSEVRSLVHKDSEESINVYQLNIQYFPETK